MLVAIVGSISVLTVLVCVLGAFVALLRKRKKKTWLVGGVAAFGTFLICVSASPRPPEAAAVSAASVDSKSVVADSSADGADTPAPVPPRWLRIDVGNRAYVRATIREVPEKTQLVCPTKTAFTEMMEDRPEGCKEEPVGSLVVIHKLRQDPGVFGGDAIYVIAKTWSGLVEDSALVPVIPTGTQIVCLGGSDESHQTLYDGNYQSKLDLGIGPFRAIVRHTLEPGETLGPSVHILSGPGSRRDGYLTFKDMSDARCHIDGTSFGLDFDMYTFEQQG